MRVFSRHGKDWTDKVPAIVEAMLALPAMSAMLDGESVVSDGRGVTDFDRLRTALAGRGGSREPFLYAFDLLALDGEDLRREPWEIRRAMLTRLLRKAGPGVRLSEHLDGDGAMKGRQQRTSRLRKVELGAGGLGARDVRSEDL